MISKIFWYLWLIKNRDRIPVLPRLYATKFDDTELTYEQRHILAKLGCRDIAGVRVAMKRHKVKTVTELIEKLKYYEPKRGILNRVKNALGRVAGGVDYIPYQRQILEDFRNSRDAVKMREIKNRLSIVSKGKNHETST